MFEQWLRLITSDLADCGSASFATSMLSQPACVCCFLQDLFICKVWTYGCEIPTGDEMCSGVFEVLQGHLRLGHV